MQRILLIDDDRELCALMKTYLEAESFSVAARHDGESGLEAALSGGYELVVLDVMLPGMGGFSVLTELRKASAAPVLMLTARDSEADKVSGLRLGADDYLTKPFSMQEFVARAQSLVRRYTALGGRQAAVPGAPALVLEGLTITPDTREVTVLGLPVELTAKEFDLLFFLASHPGRVFTKRQIYNSVWQDAYAFDDNNIMVHIRRLRKKIEPNPEDPAFIQTVRGVGYKFVDARLEKGGGGR